MDGQIATANISGKQESFIWDGLALLKRGTTSYVNEPAVTGGNPILASGKALFNDILGTTLGKYDGKEFIDNQRTSFGSGSKDGFFTGKPYVEGLGSVFLFRNYRPNLGKWTSSDPLGYPDGLNNFAYCNNRTITYVDPFGLEDLIIYGDSGGAGALFQMAAETRAAELRAQGRSVTVVHVSTGEEYINAISNSYNQHGAISNHEVFSHSGAGALYVNQGSSSESFYTDATGAASTARDINDINPNWFSSNGETKFWGCNTANGTNSFAEQYQNKTSRKTTGANSGTEFYGVDSQGNIIPASQIQAGSGVEVYMKPSGSGSYVVYE